MEQKTTSHIKGLGKLVRIIQKLLCLLSTMHVYVPGFIWKMNTQSTYEGNNWTRTISSSRRCYGPLNSALMTLNFASQLFRLMALSYMANIGHIFCRSCARRTNKMLPIAFSIIEGEIVVAWFFFLRNLRRYITLQYDLFLISDYHEPIKSA